MEFETIPETQDPVDVVLAQIDEYHNNMQTQITKMKYMIEVNNRILEAVDKMYNNSTVDELKEIYKEEVGSRQDILVQLQKSLAVMTERLSQTEKIKELVKTNLDLLKTVDFYFGCSLKLVSAEDLNEILNKYIKD